MSSEVPFFTQAAMLDQFIHSEHPDADLETLGVILEVLRGRADLREYFFRNRPNMAWVPLLWEQGFFTDPPAPVETEQGVMLPFWDAQNYLLSVAAETPKYVLRHVAALVPHPFYAARAVNALLHLGVDEMEQAVPHILALLVSLASGHLVATGAAGLLSALAEERPDTALELLGGLTRPFVNPGEQDVGGHVYGREAVALLDDYQVTQEAFQKVLDTLGRRDPSGLINVLEENLLLALRIEDDRRGHGTPSSWWRSAVEPSGQNFHHHYKDHLVDWLRDASERTALNRDGGDREMVERYLAADRDILRRLGLHLVRLGLGLFGDLARRELLDRANYDETPIHHEFFLLMEDGYRRLGKSDRGKVLDTILAGPSQDRLDGMKAWASERSTTDEDDYCLSYVQHWKLTRLWMVRQHLVGEEREQLERLVADLGEPEHPAFLIWHTGVRSVREVSPLSPEQLMSQDPATLLAYLREWQPEVGFPRGFEPVSREGLGNALAELVNQDLAKYQSYLGEMLSMHPEYAHAVLMKTARRGDGAPLSPADQEIVVSACEELLQKPDVLRSMERDALVGWRDVRQRIVEALEAAVSSAAPAHPGLLPRIRDLLFLLLDDPDPTPQDDRPTEGWVGLGDPSTVALNHVRPAVLMCLIQYAVRVAQTEETGGAERGLGPTHLEATVRAALTDKLSDPSLAVHSAFGRFLGTLYWLDHTWVETHLSDIFPPGEDEGEIALHVAAWDAYVIFNSQLHPDLFRRLRPQYERAIDNLKNGYVTKTHLQPAERLAAHLIFDHFKEVTAGATPRSTLLHAFFERVGGEHRGRAAWVLWRNCKDYAERGRPAEEWWSAVLPIWQSEVERAASQNFPSDFDKEMDWFAHLLDMAPATETVASLWPLLQGVLPYASATGHRHQVWEPMEQFLACQVTRDPVRSIELYARMHDRASGPVWARPNNLSRTIITEAASNPASRKQALALINLLGRRGDWRHRDIYERYTA